MGTAPEATIYDKGVQVWVPNPDVVWINSKIISNDGTHIECKDDNGKVHKLALADKPYLRNPAILEAVDDLTHLSYLHEPAVLNTLRTRYSTMNIYTYCGIVLVAINPFQSLDLYTDDLIREYHGQALGDLEPHLFALAEEAYNSMSKGGKDQSIVVSGESGAGKTVSAVYTMRYFATVGGSGGDRQVEKQVMASNPVMEAFGNAKTTRNNNSSRFGKYIAINFDKKFTISGAAMMTYLLEKSRVVYQAESERGYHIFYQLCAAVWENCPPELEELKLGQCMNYNFINAGNCPTVDRVNDAEEFEETRRSMSTLGITDESQLGMFRVLAAILHLGNVEITCRRTEDAVMKEVDEALEQACKLLDIPTAATQKWLLKRKIVVGRDVMIKTATKTQAISVCHAFAKHLYATIFDWIVVRINKVLQSSHQSGRFIGVLDIYGFELFQTNSFEQFCINYANEKLQQQFNQHVFKLEQEEYIQEQIKWSFIDFYDNQPCIDLIEDRVGVLSLLDEEARLPSGKDKNFLDKMKANHGKKDHFSVPRIGQNLFVIHHFAAKVSYTIDGFLDKNKDSVSEELLEVLSTSKEPFVMELFGPNAFHHEQAQKNSQGQGSAKAKVTTVGSQFKQSLQNLMDTIGRTTPHYCRCLKPNQAKKPFIFTETEMMEQLRACGVLETIRISASGYPSRSDYDDFKDRYLMLLRSDEVKTTDVKEICSLILNKVINDEDKFQFGLTKIFFRAGQVAYLEKLRSDRMKQSILFIQKYVRGFLGRNRYQRSIVTSALLQRITRGFLARRSIQSLREEYAVITMQKWVKRWHQQTKYQSVRGDLIIIQSVVRTYFSRKEFQVLRSEQAAVRIQSVGRAYIARKHYKWAHHSVIIVQNLWRSKCAKRQLKALKTADKDVSVLKEKNWGLENKIIELTRKLEESKKEIKTLHEVKSASAAKEVEASLAAMRQKNEELAESLAKSEKDMQDLQQALETSNALVAARENELEIEAAKLAERLEVERELQQTIEIKDKELLATIAQLEESGAKISYMEKEAKTQERREKRAGNITVLSTSMAPHDKSKGFSSLDTPFSDTTQVSLDAMKTTYSEPSYIREDNTNETTVQPPGPFVEKEAEASTEDVAKESEIQTMQDEREMVDEEPSYATNAQLDTEAAAVTIETANENVEEIKMAEEAVQHVENIETANENAEEIKIAVEANQNVENIETANENVEEIKMAEEAIQNVVNIETADENVETNKNVIAVETAVETSENIATVETSNERVEKIKIAIEANQNVENIETANDITKPTESFTFPKTDQSAVAIEDALRTIQSHEALIEKDNGRLSEMKRLVAENATLRSQLEQTLRELEVARVVKSLTIENIAGNAPMAVGDEMIGHTATEIMDEAVSIERSDLARVIEEKDKALLRIVQLEAELHAKDKLWAHATAVGTEAATLPESDKDREIERLILENMDLTRKLEQALKEKELAHHALDALSARNGQSNLNEDNILVHNENERLRQRILELTDPLYSSQSHQLSARRSASISNKPIELMRDHYRLSNLGNERIDLSMSPLGDMNMVEITGGMGMFQFDEKDERMLMNELILHANPKQLVGELPGVIAYILFMCIKWADYSNNQKQLQSLLTNAISTIKHVVMTHHTDIELLGFWLSNSNVLLNSMHYSEQVMDEPCDYELENFDVAEYRQVLEDLACQMYFAIVRHVQDELSRIVVAAILENDLLQGVMSGGIKKPKARGKSKSVQDVTTVLNELYKTLNENCVDPELTQQ
eukprot:Ihof_evm2s546 gene=Ihof_evmTU2s546